MALKVYSGNPTIPFSMLTFPDEVSSTTMMFLSIGAAIELALTLEWSDEDEWVCEHGELWIRDGPSR